MFVKKTIVIKAPCDGEIISLDKVKDKVFQTKMMGDGVAIIPSSNIFTAPIPGKIVAVTSTNHAYGFEHKQVELLMHIGIDTVELNGEGFDCKVKQNDKVKQGQTIVEVNLDYIAKNAPSTQTPLIITNGAKFKILKMGQVKMGDPIMEIE